MHRQHDIFVSALRDKRKLFLSFLSSKNNLYSTKLCIPVSYSPPDSKDDSEYYRIWDSESEVGERLIDLPASGILYMELSSENFTPDEYILPDL